MSEKRSLDSEFDPVKRTIHVARQMQRESGNGSTRVGASIWRFTELGGYEGLAVGTNRFPRRFLATEARSTHHFDTFDLHAESNAIAFAARKGRLIKDAQITVSHCPCPECASLIIEAGLSHVLIDGEQKLRPNFYRNWLPTKRLSLEMLGDATVKVTVHDLHLKPDGTPDLAMSEEEAAGSPVRQLSGEPIVVRHPDTGYERFVRAVQESEAIPKPRPADRWIEAPYHGDAPLPDLPPALKRLAAIADQRIESRRAKTLPSHVAILFDERGTPLLTELARPPRGSAHRSAVTLHPEPLLVAHAARDGIAMEGKNVYLTHLPNNRSAVMLAGAGIDTIYVDPRNLPEALDQVTAGQLWSAHALLEEAGVKTVVLGSNDAEKVYAGIRGQADPALVDSILRREDTPALRHAGRSHLGGLPIGR